MASTQPLPAETTEALVTELGRLKIERIARGNLTLDEIAERTGFDRAEWSRTEGGQRPMTDAKAKALAYAYGVTADEVWSWVGGRPASESPR
jgi:transcriptional regulator with XRE-family HTH domain